MRTSLLQSQDLGPSTVALSPVQSQVDSLVGNFIQQATDWRSLAAMMAGGMTYRLGRVGAMAAGTGRIASVGIGLGAEVTAFEMANRSLSSLTGETQSNPNLWRWEGQGGIRQGLLNSLVTFGALKGAGRLAQGENVVVQHLLQNTGMVLGHQVSASFGITDRPQGTLAEQFLHAEATNLQLSAGMALAHSVAPGIQGLERGLDLSLRLTPDILDSPLQGQPPDYGIWSLKMQQAFASAGEQKITALNPELLDRNSRGENLTLMANVNSKDEGPSGELEIKTSGTFSAVNPNASREINYPRDIDALLRSAEAQMTDPSYLEGSREELLAKRLDEETADQIFFFQLPYFLREFPGVTFHVTDIEALKEPAPDRSPEEVRPQFLTQALSLLGSRGKEGSMARWVVDASIPFSLYGEEASPFWVFGEEILKRIQTLVFPQYVDESLHHVIHFYYPDPETSALHLRFLSLSLLEKLLQVVHGRDASQFHYVWGEIPRDAAMRLRGLRAPPVGLQRSQIFFKDLGVTISPASYTIHDGYFHTARDAQIPNPYPEVCSWIYETLQGNLPASPVKEKLLDLLSDLELENVPAHDLRALLHRTLSPIDEDMDEATRGVRSEIAGKKDLEAMNRARDLYENYHHVLIPAMRGHPILEREAVNFSQDLNGTLNTYQHFIQAYGERSRDEGVSLSFLQENLSQLSDTRSVLSEESKKSFRTSLENALRGDPPLSSTPAQLLRILQEDFMEKLREMGLFTSPAIVLDGPLSLYGENAELPSWMKDLIRETLPSDLFLREEEVPRDISIKTESPLPDLRSQLNLTYSVLRLLSFELSLPMNSLYFEREDGQKTFRLLPPILLVEAARRIYGTNAVRIDWTSRMSTHEEMEAMFVRDTRPFLLTSLPQSLHGVKNVHPYLAALHDLFHLLRISRISPEVRRNFVGIRYAFVELQPHVEKKELIDVIMEGIMDGNLGRDSNYRSFFQFVRNQAPGRDFIEGLKRNLEARFSDDPRGKPILEAFEEVLRRSH